MKNRCLNSRFLGIFCLALCLALPFARAWGYAKMGNDRILLMNNDKKTLAGVTTQGYYDTNTSQATYWVHVGTSKLSTSPAKYLLLGTNHVMYAKDGTRLWDLRNCRAGSGTVVGSSRNYIPWSDTAYSIVDNSLAIPETAAGQTNVGSVVMRNIEGACVYSPFYEEGIGTIYFDAVNAFVNAPDIQIDLQIATNSLGGADFRTAENNDENFNWQTWPFEAFAVTGKSTVSLLESACTNLTLASESGYANLFYRGRLRLDYRGPIRFRIRRLNKSSGQVDTAGLALIDNIIASYPPMSAVLCRYGNELDKTMSGVETLGVQGDVDSPFVSIGQMGVRPYAYFYFLTNSAVTTALKLKDASFHYRWRYLNQIVGDWQTIPFDQDNISSKTYMTSNLVGITSLSLTNGVGDLEYFFSATLDAPYYQYREYAFPGVRPAVGYGEFDVSEEITAITNRATYTVADQLPSGGTDWFTRIREGASDCAYVSLVGDVTTNGVWQGMDMHANDLKNAREKMELVGDHTWRYNYYIPTNYIGERIRFHFEGVKYVTNGTSFAYTTSNCVWYAVSTNVTSLPITMSATSAGDTNGVIVQLDGTGTHLQIEFNDELGSFALSRGSYQDFNMWTDARIGYRGNSSETSGVSDVKMRFDAKMDDWPSTAYANPNFWRESFDVEDNDPRYTNYVKRAGTTPNGWSYENGMFVPRNRSRPFKRAIELAGEGKGALMLSNLAEENVPRGIGSVTFSARVAQVPEFNDFCWNYFESKLQTYAIFSKVTMSQRFESSQYNPSDVSPANPSVSLIGYRRGDRPGCYEFRVTRTAQDDLTVALYRWKNREPELLVSNVVRRAASAILWKSSDPNQNQGSLGVGKALNSDTDGNNDNFGNLLVPTSNTETNSYWSWMGFSLFTAPDNSVRLKGYLSKKRNRDSLEDDLANVKCVVAYIDSNSELAKGGSYGVGSVGCQAAFGEMRKHEFMSSTDESQGIQTSGTAVGLYDEWDFMDDRWQLLQVGDNHYNASGFRALIPTNQTVKMLLAKPGEKDGWFESGWETNVVAFATNTFTFAPCVAPDYLVRLQTGEAEADIVINEVEVTAWRGEDMVGVSSSDGRPDNWAYTMSSIETAADIDRPYDLVEAGANGYAFVFSNGIDTVKFTPRLSPMSIDRVLLAGNGKVRIWDWSSSPVSQPTNKTITITVGNSNNVSKIVGLQGQATTLSSTDSGSVTSVSNDITGTLTGYSGELGVVIIRARTASKVCVLQPTRNYPIDGKNGKDAFYPMSVRSKYMENGLSQFSFSYVNADTNASLLLQISTNNVARGNVRTHSIEPANGDYWTPLTNWTFKGMTDLERKNGTLTYFLSLRAPKKGLIRLVVDPKVVTNALALAKNEATRNLDYGKITITRVLCHDEPPLDERSWWGWNLHTEGWDGTPGRWAYLTDSPDGLSCSLNFSALATDNQTTLPETYGIGLGDMANDEEYKKNNPFVQCPPITNGIGSVSFRARTFETNAATAAEHPAVVILYGSEDKDAEQTDERDESWQRLSEFQITNNTYQTYSWKTNLITAPWKTIRLEVGGARHGRNPANSLFKSWETPSVMSLSNYKPIQRVFLDEVSVSEPVGPRLKFFDVRPFRSNLDGSDTIVITNINSRDEQPLIGESWGIQARVEPQQMSDELDVDSIHVYMAAYVGMDPWGYEHWKDKTVDSVTRFEAELECVDKENLIYRSTFNNPSSVIAPVSALPGSSYNVVQYFVWAEYRTKEASPDEKPLVNPLSSADWVRPAWFFGIEDYNKLYGFGQPDKFSGYTILDTISPGRAWINEVNYNNYLCTDPSVNDNYQFIEIVLPEHTDMKGWGIRLTSGETLQNAYIARFGSEGQPVYRKERGMRPGIDSKDKFTLMTLVAPRGVSLFDPEKIDGTWDTFTSEWLNKLGLVSGSSLNYSSVYGLELVRSSRVVEHQVVVSGTNFFVNAGWFAGRGDPLVITEDLKKQTGSDALFYAGEDKGGSTKPVTLGVFRGHGEELWEDQPTWTNDLQSTPGEFNLRNGHRQEIGDWLLESNGTNIWVYATVYGSHTWQYVDGNPAHTNKNARMVVKSGDTTNVYYKVDSWYELADCTTNNKPVMAEKIAPNTFKIELPNVTHTIDLVVWDKGESELFGTKKWAIREDDPYKPAILDWLLRKWPNKGAEDIVPAEHRNQSGAYVGELNLKEMYWLDIPPVVDRPGDGEKWWLVYDLDRVQTFPDPDGSYTQNGLVTVKMMITNTLSGDHHPPYTIQGLQPGSSSSDDYTSSSLNWTSATFKVTGSLAADTQQEPVRWFVFDRNSFSEDGIAKIEVPDQSKPRTPGNSYGWTYFNGFFYKTALDERPSGVFKTEILKAVDTNICPPSVLSP